MWWLLVVIIAHLFNAGAFLVDKYLLKKSIPQPALYAFFIGVLGLLSLVLLPFGIVLPHGWWQIVIIVASGFCFIWALYYFFNALKFGETSKVVPLIGGTQPIVIFILSFFLLNERLNPMQILAFVLLLVGSVLITLEFGGKKKSSTRRYWFYALLSSVLFAVAWVSNKEVYNQMPFMSGFLWIRIAAAFCAALFMLSSVNRRKLGQMFGGGKKQETSGKKTGALFFTGQASGALGFVLVSYAISLASASLVLAMQGVQYVFLLIIAVLLSSKYPHILKEELNRKIIAQKIISIFLISLGLFLLALSGGSMGA